MLYTNPRPQDEIPAYGPPLRGFGVAVRAEDLLERSHGLDPARGRQRLDVHGIKPAQSLDYIVVEVAAEVVSTIRAVTGCHVCLPSRVRHKTPRVVSDFTLRNGRWCCRSGP